jgi:hypothetical protein
VAAKLPTATRAGTALGRVTRALECRRSQSGTGWSSQDPAFPQKQGTGHA